MLLIEKSGAFALVVPSHSYIKYFLKLLQCIKNIDMEMIITYNNSTKIHTEFSTERGVIYVGCKEHGC